MKKSKSQSLIPPSAQPARLATAVATSAVSLSLLTSEQTPLQAQSPPPKIPIAQQNAQASDEEAFEKYFNMGYNYCDAVVLAAYWGEGTTPGDAKARLGHKMLQWGWEDGDLHVRTARGQALAKKDDELPAWIDDGGYSYNDAEVLASYWKTEDVWESKVTMSRLLIGGHDKVIRAALKSAKGG